MKLLTYTIITLIIGLANLNAQKIGDYKSVGSGNWTSIGVWNTYNGTAWISATYYPGQITGTNDVLIIGGNSVSISSNIPNTINSVTAGDGTGALDNFFVSGTSSLNTQVITIANGGYAEWISNVSLSLPAGANFKIDPGGELAMDKPCNAAKRLIIGTTTYSTCNGAAGAQYSFNDLNDEGGTLSVTPTSNSPICEGDLLNLYSNPSGTGSSGASFLWTGPNGYTSTNQNPVISDLTQGNYDYTVTIRDSAGNTNTKTLSISVLPTPVITSTTPGFRNGPGTVVLGASTSYGTLNWYLNSSGGSSLGTGPSFTTPAISTSTSFYVETSENGCISDRVVVLATVNNNSTVITNRKITYRIKKN
ncbi:hypothetical protein [Maribacter arcticus]|uniref:immunoglobulin domain-containing protein n=1 Tax=Maribacter arcticus TaxID=561365 RepID=UPI003001ED6E